jgi:hypothetical protein
MIAEALVCIGAFVCAAALLSFAQRVEHGRWL